MHSLTGTNKFLLSQVESSAIPTRDEIDERYKWNLRDVYKEEQDWENDFKWIEDNIIQYSRFEGKLSGSPDTLLECLKFDDEVGIKLERMHLYAMLSKDSDMKVTLYQGMADRIQTLYSKVSSAASFIRPELLAIPEDSIKETIRNVRELKIYEHYLNDLFRAKAHTLNKDSEALLALSSEVNQNPYNVFSMFTNADMKFPVVKDDDGNDIQISHARYYAAIYSQDRNFRQRVFKNYYMQYIDYANTFAALFNGNLKSNIFISTARKYSSSKEASLDKNNIPVSVYDNLLTFVNDNLEPLHRWAALRKKIMKLDELHPYDVYVSLFNVLDEKKYSYEEAKEIVLKALRSLGDEYLKTLNTAFDNRWIDVYETNSKRSGAYSSGTTFGVHPYVLLNWAGLLNDVFTLAHEMGHNMHSYYTGENQPFVYANYSIFLAEVASTFNESLLLDYLIENAKSKNEKLYLIEKYLNNISATFYRQTMFAEFENDVYKKAESGIPLTPDALCKMYKDLYSKYWGSAMTVDKEEEYTWARVPHFYYNFYVFQYATGFAASEILSKKVKNEGRPAVEKYISFLKAGSSDYPINILKNAGVDMNSSEPVLAVAQKMSLLLDEMESLITS